MLETTYTMTAGPPVVRPYRKSEGMPVMIEMIEKETLRKIT
jgi:hypothetical protein